MSQLQSFLERYQDEFIINRSVGRLEPNESKAILTSVDVSLDNTFDSAAHLLALPTPRGIAAAKKKNPRKLLRKQTQIDAQQLRVTTTKLFNENVWQDKFFAYAKGYTNEVISDPDEEVIFKLLKEYEK